MYMATQVATKESLQRGLPGFPGRRGGDYEIAAFDRVRFNGVSLVSQGEGAERRRRLAHLLGASTGSPWFPREKGRTTTWADADATTLQRGLPGFPGRRSSAGRLSSSAGLGLASTGSPWFPREKAHRSSSPPPPGRASTGSPWFPREKAYRSPRRSGRRCGLQRGLPGFPGRRELTVSMAQSMLVASTGSPWFPREKEGVSHSTARLRVLSLQRGLPGFPGRRSGAEPISSVTWRLQRGLPGFPGRRRLRAGGGPGLPASFNGVSLVSQGEGAPFREGPKAAYKLQRGLPGFPGRRHQPRILHAAVQAAYKLQRGLPGFPGRRGGICSTMQTQRKLQRGLPGFPGRRYFRNF